MAGGKETPRQKMIGMMYLVLTALLALNVSKSILDAFVAIEENTQKSAIVQLERGNGLKSNLESVKKTALGEKNLVKAAKCTYYGEKLAGIDAKTADIIEYIDKIKILILEKSGEKVNTDGVMALTGEGKNATIDWSKVHDKEKDKSKYGVEDKDIIIWKRYDKKDPLRPSRMNLAAVQAKDQYDVPMHEIIGELINNPDKEKFGLSLWDKYNSYRSYLVETVGTNHGKNIDSISGKGVGQPVFSLKAKMINDFKDNADLDKKVDDMLKGSKINKKDIGVLKQLYMELTKQERFPLVNDVENVHWIGKTFDHSPLVAALASLTTMQLEILNARAVAAAWCSGQVGNASYSFNELVALADGPGTVADGEAFEISVVIGAYDTDNQPTATGGDFRYEGGKAIMKAVGSGEDMTYKGTIAIKNNDGVAKQLDWEKKISVIKGSTTAAIMCEDIQVVYAGIPMNFRASASGMYKSVTCSPSVVNASAAQIGQKITVSATGVGKDGKSVGLGSQQYTVKPCPVAKVFWNGVGEGGRPNKSAGNLTVAFGDEVPFDKSKGKFSVVSYIITVSGLKGSLEGSGGTIQAGHLNAIKNAGGGKCTISVKYTGTANNRTTAMFDI